MSAQTCDSCAYTMCVSDGTSPSTDPSAGSSGGGGGPNVGAIAGGVIGGVLAVAILTYLVWRFCIKNKRQQYAEENWQEDPNAASVEKDFTMRRDARASTHTVGSIASTVFTRASNIIQIAYIPGVTNRSAPSTPGLLVPPVPPIPMGLSSTASTPNYEHDHFFMPGDLRDSTYSGVTDRSSMAPSMAPTHRASVASTIYGKNAVISPVPAQTVIRGKAAVVSVKSSSPHDLTPPVPTINYDKYSKKPREPPSPAFSIGSTFLNKANSATQATQLRPQMVSVVSVNSTPKRTPRQSLESAASKTKTLVGTSSLDEGPFSDPPTQSSDHDSLSAMIEEATRRAQSDSQGGLGGKRGDGTGTPFGDEHETNL